MKHQPTTVVLTAATVLLSTCLAVSVLTNISESQLVSEQQQTIATQDSALTAATTELGKAGEAMTGARHAIKAQGAALEQCMRVADAPAQWPKGKAP